MEFKDFIHKLSSVIRAGGSTDKFTRSIFEAIVTEEGQPILDEYKKSSYKGFYNGSTSIRKISQKINAYIDPMEFSDYINQFPDAVAGTLSNVFSADIPDINPCNAAEKIADLFVSIITEAADSKNKPAEKPLPPIIIDAEHGIAPDLAEYQDGILYMQGIKQNPSKYVNPFKKYIDNAIVI